MDNTKKFTVFIQGDLQLESATNFNQYIFKGESLITLIGERHKKDFKCNTKNPISISSYCKLSVKNNNSCKILLEYNPGQNPEMIGSYAINSIFKELSSIKKENTIVPFDYRSYFLTPRGKEELYSRAYYKYENPEIYKRFVQPFYDKLNKDINLFKLKGNYDKNIVKYLSCVYYSDITKSFSSIKIALDSSIDKTVSHQLLKDVWMKVCDYFILREILRNDQTNEYIIVAGEKHIENLEKTLSDGIALLLSKQEGRGGDKCATLFNTYLF